MGFGCSFEEMRWWKRGVSAMLRFGMQMWVVIWDGAIAG
jgi:hypothetical protein